MTLQTLCSIDLLSLSKRDLKALCINVREATGRPFDLRATVTKMLDYLETYKTSLLAEMAYEQEVEEAIEVAREVEVFKAEVEALEVIEGFEVIESAPVISQELKALGFTARVHIDWAVNRIKLEPSNYANDTYWADGLLVFDMDSLKIWSFADINNVELFIAERLEEFELAAKQEATVKYWNNWDALYSQAVKNAVGAIEAAKHEVVYNTPEQLPDITFAELGTLVQDAVEAITKGMSTALNWVWGVIPSNYKRLFAAMLKRYRNDVFARCNSFKEMVKASKLFSRVGA